MNKEPNFIFEAKECYSKVYMFFSIDFVGSTKYKADDENWSLFYREALDKIYEKFSQPREEFLKYWKFSGDEIVFYGQVESLEQIISNLKKIYDEQNKILNGEYDEFREFNQKLSLKSTCWISYIDDPNADADVRETNIVIPIIGKELRNNLSGPNDVEYVESLKQYEFIGPSIDEGFRITSLSRQGVVTINFDLAVLLSFYAEETDGLFAIVGFKRLKGIWKNNLYPVCWYFKNLENYKDFVKKQPYYFLPSECEILKDFECVKFDDNVPGYLTDINRVIPAINEYLTNLKKIIGIFGLDGELINEIDKSDKNPSDFEEYYINNRKNWSC
jgi:hypothetical protein